MKKKQIIHLLEKYHKGECTTEETRIIHQWYSGLGNRDGLDLEETEKKLMEDIIWNRLQNEIENDGWSTKKTRYINWRYLSGAAAVFLLISAFLRFDFSSKQIIPSDSPAMALHESEIGVVREVNSTAQLKKLVLSDGSIITLTPESALTYPRDFSNELREVTLEGDAFFEIAPHTQWPFIVKKDKLITKVMGTSFWIKGDAKSGTLEVSVVTGKVSVFDEKELSINLSSAQPDNNSILIEPNEKAIYDMLTGDITRSLTGSLPHESIIAPSMVMDNRQLPELLDLFNAIYGVDIELVQPKMANCNFTGDLSNMQFYDALELLCKSVGARYEALGGRIMITGEGC